MHGTTFGGGPLACAVALELLKVMQQQALLKHIRKTGSYLQEKLQELKREHSAIREVRALGLMAGVELESAELAKEVFKKMLDRGVIVNRTDETVVRMLPPFIVKKQHVDQVVRLLDEVLSKNTVEFAATGQRRQK
jgi:acetylornithine aminotransferase/acetylornithine/N-succinyldiaminopimelate aminotransferase